MKKLSVTSNFPDKFKTIDVTPVLKKERLIQQQLHTYVGQYLYLYLCWYRKSYGTQTVVFFLLEKWRLCLDKKGVAGTVLIDIIKAFN